MHKNFLFFYIFICIFVVYLLLISLKLVSFIIVFVSVFIFPFFFFKILMSKPPSHRRLKTADFTEAVPVIEPIISESTKLNDVIQQNTRRQSKFKSKHERTDIKLKRQLGKTFENNDKLTEEQMDKTLPVHLWKEKHVLTWLKTVLNPYFNDDNSDNNEIKRRESITKIASGYKTLSDYQWNFSSNHIDGTLLLLNFKNINDFENIGISPNNGYDINILDALLKHINTLKKRAKKEIENVHPVRRSNIDPKLKKAMRLVIDDDSDNEDDTAKEIMKLNDGIKRNRCGHSYTINQRKTRITLLSVNVFIYGILSVHDFFKYKVKE